ncbi:MAG: hypothetical protein LUE16_04910 [Lachnospiraceae bacterium]|nr:hypothetical protein [Lachnospiraceae bacterium]
MKPVAYISSGIIHLLNLDMSADTPVYIGEINVEHIKSRHPYEYEKYFSEIALIISQPDYVGINPKDSSILFVKLYPFSKDYVRVAVKPSASKICYVKTLHCLSTCNAERYIKKGTLIPLT